MSMASTATVLPIAPPPRKSKVTCFCSYSPSNSSSITETTNQETSKKFTYSRASPSIRWPNLKFTETDQNPQFKVTDLPIFTSSTVEEEEVAVENLGEELVRSSRTQVKKMTKLALKRAKDWRERVQFLTDRILGLKNDEFVADVLDERNVQMTPTDYCFVVKWVGNSSWQRALEVFEWLNLRHWYAPNARMLATIISILGKANQESLAVEIFTSAEPVIGNTVQVYNAMMGVYARNGQFKNVQKMLDVMRTKGCEPDLVSLNTLINARLKSGYLEENSALELLNEVRSFGMRPDIITYNTLISACSRDSNLEEARKVFADMEKCRCQPDLWTYNAMLSVFGRCGLFDEAERLFQELESKGFSPDSVTYNSLIYAFAREGNVEKVKEICEEMVKKGFAENEMTYNTLIHMYGKQGQHELALKIYREMKSCGRDPDVVTYTVLIDSLGKADKINEAAKVMTEMLNTGVKPTLKTYSAMICAYAKAGQRDEAVDTYNCMLKSGIKPDILAYSVMLDIYLRYNEIDKAMKLCSKMVRDGFKPDLSLFERLLRVLGKENRVKCVELVVKDMEDFCNLNPQVICSILLKAECYDYANEFLRLGVTKGRELDREVFLSIISCFSSSGRYLEAKELLDFANKNTSGSDQGITEATILVMCKSNQLEEALKEYNTRMHFGLFSGNVAVNAMYESLIKWCKEKEFFYDASQLFSDMLFTGLNPSQEIYQVMIQIYCEMGFPETAFSLIPNAELKGISIDEIFVSVALIEAYGKLNLLEKAENIVGNLRKNDCVVDRKAWNALIQAYAVNGCYEKARAAFNTMMRDGPSPTNETVDSLMQALIVDNRLKELYVLIDELQDMDFKMSKGSICLMLEAFAKAGEIFEVKKIYNGMKAAGYYPTMHLYRVMISLFARGKRVTDVEAMVNELEDNGFKPDLPIYNILLKLYTKIEDYKKAVQVFKKIQDSGLNPDEDTYNSLIVMYCRDCRPEEGLLLMNEMRKSGLVPNSDTYKSLIAAFVKQKRVEEAEELFRKLRSEGYKFDRSIYHLMMKLHRSCGNHSAAEELLVKMKEDGIEPNAFTMNLLIISYGSSGRPEEAEKVLDNLKLNGENLGTLPYTSVINAYLKNGDYNVGVEKLLEMKKDGLEADHRIWTCFIRAASFCQTKDEALFLLNAIADAGCDIPVKLLTENSDSLVMEVDEYLMNVLATVEEDDDAAFNFVNALEDLLWSFELRGTASWLFQLAMKRNIYPRDVFRVADLDWGADFRKLSGGAALVGITLWLDHMQDAALEGHPESPKSVVLVTGMSEYNQVALNTTIKAYLWEMGSPFLPCKTRTGLLIAKAHSLRMWLKDSPFCLDLELKNSPNLPETNSMQLIEGCYIRKGLVPAYNDIISRLGFVRPKLFARLALLSDEKRDKVIEADIKGRREKLEKWKKLQKTRIQSKKKKFRGPYIRSLAVKNVQ